jgi:hypothetical protein
MLDRLDQLDVPYLLVQTGLLVGLAFVPLFLISVVSPRRRWLSLFVLACAVVAWAVVFWSVVVEVDRYLPTGDAPYKPFRVGPSLFGIWDSIPFFAMVLWGPTLGAYWVIRIVARRRHLRIRPILVIIGIVLGSLFSAAVVWWASLEDTFSTPGFSWKIWQDIRQGMTREEVHRILGPPLPGSLQPSFAREQGAEVWVSNLSVGYFAVVWFENNRVARTRLWYSD